MTCFSRRLSHHIPSRISSKDKAKEIESTNQDKVNEKLTRARIEGKRRQLNQARKEHHHLLLLQQQQQSFNRATSSLDQSDSASTSSFLTPSSSTSSALSSSSHSNSASSRAGLLYFSSTSLSSAEAQQKEKNRLLKRQVAGPVPPNSWQDEFEQRRIRQETRAGFRTTSQPQPQIGESQSSIENSSEIQLIQDETVQIDPGIIARAQRRSACSSTRSLFSKSSTSSIKNRSRSSFSTLSSLSDLVLCSIIDTLNRGPSSDFHNSSQSNQGRDGEHYQSLLRLLLIDEVYYLPIHLKLRMCELAGRESKSSEPLSWNALRALWLTSEEEKISEEDSKPKMEGRGTAKEQSQGKDIIDKDWDDSSSTSDQDQDLFKSSSPSPPEVLDLSFSLLSRINLKSLLHLNPESNINLYLKELSLAGSGSQLALESQSNNGSTSTSTSTIPLGTTEFLSLFSSLPNLKILSLAHTNLKPFVKFKDIHGRITYSLHSASSINTLTPLLFLKKLSNSTPGLEKLDLSECDWVDSKALTGVSWSSGLTRTEGSSSNRPSFTAWNDLKVLVLTNCQSFSPYLTTSKSSRSTFKDQYQDGDGLGEKAGIYFSRWHSEHFSNLRRNASSKSIRDHHQTTVSRRIASSQLSNDPEVLTAFGNQDRGQVVRNHDSSFSSSFPTRCPITGERIEPFQWERARTLDLLRGRNKAWIESLGDDGVENGHFAVDRNFIEVYF